MKKIFIMKIGSYEINVPFVTTSAENLKTVIDLAEIKKDQMVTDLGSGDGRVVLAFGKAGAIVHGYEYNPQLILRSRQRISDAGLAKTIHIYETSFWNVPLSAYDLVYIYGMESILGKLEQKLNEELKPGAKFITNIFRLPHWKVKKTVNNVNLYVKQF